MAEDERSALRPNAQGGREIHSSSTGCQLLVPCHDSRKGKNNPCEITLTKDAVRDVGNCQLNKFMGRENRVLKVEILAALVTSMLPLTLTLTLTLNLNLILTPTLARIQPPP